MSLALFPGARARAKSANADRIARLSVRERECLRLVGDGLSSKKIARILAIKPASVDTLIQRARDKLGVSDRMQAAKMLLEHEAAEAGEGEPSTAALLMANVREGPRVFWAALVVAGGAALVGGFAVLAAAF